MLAAIAPWTFALFLWWFSTGLILFLEQTEGRGRSFSMAGSTLLAAAAFWVVGQTRDLDSVYGAYCGFTCAVFIWGWVEMTFLRGHIAGPRKEPCPQGATGHLRFALALEVLLYHELLLVVLLSAFLAVSIQHANNVAALTFAVLWVARLSSKLNIFLGVPRFSPEFLPEGMRYIVSYGRVSPINLLFPLSVTAATVVSVAMLGLGLQSGIDSQRYVALSLVNAMLLLAVLEHWFLVLPIEDALLWRWLTRPKKPVAGLVLARGSR